MFKLIGVNWHWFKSELRERKVRVRLTIGWLFATTIGGLLPLYAGMVLVKLLNQPVSLSDFFRNGEFALYAASFIAPALYQLFRDLKNPFPHRMILGLLSVVLLMVSTVVFAGVFVVARLPPVQSHIDINISYLGIISFILLLVAIAATTVITFYDISLMDETIDPARKMEHDVDLLADKMHAIGDDES